MLSTPAIFCPDRSITEATPHGDYFETASKIKNAL
jgi:hypothetical protein